MTLTCFKAYDIRGRIPDELNTAIAYRIGRAYASFLQAPGTLKVVVGHDIRLSSKAISEALINALRDAGLDVFDIGTCGSEEIYFATTYFKMDAGMMVTASHNPKDFNGIKLVREDAKPVSADTGLKEIQRLAEANNFADASRRGALVPLAHRDAYIARLLEYVDIGRIRRLKVVVNAGNGGAGAIIDRLERFLSIELIKVHHQADGNFPNGVPNPMRIENRASTIHAIQSHGADLGIAWDGDFDRCFFFDADGRFIESYYIVGLLAKVFLKRAPGSVIVHDPRLTWNTQDIVKVCGGRAVMSKTGHGFMKQRMRIEDAIYGGEMSGHHYFKDFAYCDSGILPWLLVMELMRVEEKSLAELVNARMAAFPVSGEINRSIADPPARLRRLEQIYSPASRSLDHTDGLSICFDDWRFNVRMSNTEAVVRLNVESRADPDLMKCKTAAILAEIGGEII